MQFLWETIQKPVTLFLVTQACPRRCGIPSWDIDVVPVREIIQFQSKSESLYPNPPHPPTGEWWRRRGARDYEQDYYKAQNYLPNVNPGI